MELFKKSFFILSLLLGFSTYSTSQCNTNTTICDNNALAGPFNFQPASANPSILMVRELQTMLILFCTSLKGET